MKVSSWIRLTEEFAVNLEANAPGDQEMPLEQWMNLVYESLSDHEHDYEDEDE
jgi:hypothetical protein